MPTLATYEHCSGCGACSFKCPKNCISMVQNTIGVKLPIVDSSLCVECGSCERVCPALNPPAFHKPGRALAAWNKDFEQRRTSASGGIAAALYEYAIKEGWYVVGASLNADWTVTHKIVDSITEIAQFKNSKYVFSEACGVFRGIKELLKKGDKVLMIGLPCQISAMRKLFPGNPNLLLVDIVCHGIMPDSYLQQHISALEAGIGKKAAKMSFRAPEKGTANYYFTLYDECGDIFYSKRSADGDLYNIAFHRSIAYRENCYHCHYARAQRVSDLTLGDYHGLGLKAPADYEATDVSVILVNTQNGKNLIESVQTSGLIHNDERPVNEPLEGDAQLRRPSPKSEGRKDFEILIVKNNGNFEKTMTSVMRKSYMRSRRRAILNFPRRIVRKVLGTVSK